MNSPCPSRASSLGGRLSPLCRRQVWEMCGLSRAIQKDVREQPQLEVLSEFLINFRTTFGHLDLGSANFFYKGPNSKCFGFGAIQLLSGLLISAVNCKGSH